jgi:hypothetical protein
MAAGAIAAIVLGVQRMERFGSDSVSIGRWLAAVGAWLGLGLVLTIGRKLIARCCTSNAEEATSGGSAGAGAGAGAGGRAPKAAPTSPTPSTADEEEYEMPEFASPPATPPAGAAAASQSAGRFLILGGTYPSLPPRQRAGGGCTGCVLVIEEKFTLEDAIEFHAFAPLEALASV